MAASFTGPATTPFAAASAKSGGDTVRIVTRATGDAAGGDSRQQPDQTKSTAETISRAKGRLKSLKTAVQTAAASGDDKSASTIAQEAHRIAQEVSSAAQAMSAAASAGTSAAQPTSPGEPADFAATRADAVAVATNNAASMQDVQEVLALAAEVSAIAEAVAAKASAKNDARVDAPQRIDILA